MANNKSAKKRIQVAERNRLVNKSYKSTVRTLTKKTLANCEKYKQEPNSGNKELVQFSVNEAFSLIDKAVKKNVIQSISKKTERYPFDIRMKLFYKWHLCP